MRTMMVDRERREKEIAEEMRKQDAERTRERERQERIREEERRRYEEENERRITATNKQMEMLQDLVRGHTEKDAKRDSDPMKLTRLTDVDDIESYLTTFERMMKAYEVDTARWAFKLAPQLTGRAQQAYAALDPSDAECYTTVKAAILRRYNINEETYCQRFRSFKYRAGKTPTEIATRLTDLAGRWLKDCSTFEEVKDAVVKEQLLTTLPEDVRMWVKERKPKTTTDAAQLAEDYLQARPAGTPPKPDHAPTGPCPRCGELGHWARLCPTNPRPPPTRQQQSTDTPRNPQTHVNSRPSDQNSRPQDVKCYNCSAKGHLSYNCPQKALFSSTTPAIVTNKRQERAYQRGTINGVYCKDIVVDTGASKTLVHSDLVTQDDILEGVVNIQCAHGDIVSYPLAAVKIAVEGKEIIAHAAVAQSLPVAALLGWDVPDLMALVNPGVDTKDGGGTARAFAAVTRRQKESQNIPPVTADIPVTNSEDSYPEDPVDDTTPNTEPQPLEGDDSAITEFDFEESLFSPPGLDRPMLTRSQKRAARGRYHAPVEDVTAPNDFQSLDISAEEMRALQKTDPTLEPAWLIANGAQSAAAGQQFCSKDGLLYRKYHKTNSDPITDIDQLVLPAGCRRPVAHDIPMAGHLGRRKTVQRILQRYYWLGVYRDVRDHCRCCEQCQKSSPRRNTRVPLIPLPIIDTPFKRIAMDIVGPLPRSSSGKQFILVICDYATRYPEAVALRSIEASRVAKELFARVGVPEEILTD